LNYTENNDKYYLFIGVGGFLLPHTSCSVGYHLPGKFTAGFEFRALKSKKNKLAYFLTGTNKIHNYLPCNIG